MKKNAKVVIGCSIVAAVCFGIVSYGHFYRGRMGLGWVFAVLTVAQLALAVMNYSIAKKKLTVITLQEIPSNSEMTISFVFLGGVL